MYRSEFCDARYDEKRNIALVEWKKFCRDDDYRSPLLFALEIMKTHHDCHYMADTRNGFENDPADTQWLFDVFLPQTAQTTCKKFIFLIDRDDRLKEELEGQAVELRKLFDVHYCFDMKEAEVILAQCRV